MEMTMMFDCGFSKENSRFRYCAGGLLIHDGKILFAKNAIGGYFYILGGGVHMGETSEHCIEREFLEETGMHHGGYDAEPETIALMDAYLAENGYVNDLNAERLHHEIYLSDPRKAAPEKWKTVIRHPIKYEVR